MLALVSIKLVGLAYLLSHLVALPLLHPLPPCQEISLHSIFPLSLPLLLPLLYYLISFLT